MLVSLDSEQPTRRSPIQGRRIRRRRQKSLGKVAPPRMSPSRFFQDQGGIEGIIQEAAKGVYSHSEKWGVAKALRGAMQGLQSGTASPKKLSNGMRWSLDDGKIVSDDASHLTEKIRALEKRDIALAKMLEHAMEELWTQQKAFTKEEAETAADALSLAIAKVQFVQVYLENSNMPFPAADLAQEAIEATESATAGEDSTDQKANSHEPALKPNALDVKMTSKSEDGSLDQSIIDSSSSSPPIKITASPKKAIIPDRPGPSPFHRPRPSLAQSSFSWMLGEDQRRSSFVSPSPFPSEKRNARGKVGFLFGDDKADSGMHSAVSKGKEAGDGNGEESITLGTLKGGFNEEG